MLLGTASARLPVVGPDCESLDVSGGAACDVYSHLRFASGSLMAAFAPRTRPCHADEITATLADGTEVGHATHGTAEPQLAIPFSPAGREAATRNRPLFLNFTTPGTEASAAVGVLLR